MLLGGRLLSRSLRLPYLASASLLALLVPLVAGRANETHPAGARSPLALRPPGARPARPAGRLRLVCGWFAGWFVGWFVGGLWVICGVVCVAEIRPRDRERSPEIARDRPRHTSPPLQASASCASSATAWRCAASPPSPPCTPPRWRWETRGRRIHNNTQLCVMHHLGGDGRHVAGYIHRASSPPLALQLNARVPRHTSQTSARHRSIHSFLKS